MPTRAYVLIETAPGKTKDVVNGLRGAPGVVSVEAVTGPYDAVAVVEADDLNKVGDIVTSRIHTAAGTTRTLTCIAIDLT